MKKTKAKKKKLINNFLCLLLCLVFGLGGVLFSGCWLEDEYNKARGSLLEQYIAGFNTVYANSETQQRQITDNLNAMLKNVSNGMLYNYGSGNNKYEDYAHGEVFPDSIRMLVYSANGNADGTIATKPDIRWNWFFNPYLKNTLLKNLVSDSTSSFSDWFAGLFDETDPYFQNDYKFPEAMNVALRIVLYEIMLGYEPLKLEVESGDKIQVEDKGLTLGVEAKYYYIKIKDCSNKSIIGKYLHQEREGVDASSTIGGITYNWNFSEINQTVPDKEITEYLNKLAEEYKNSTLYNGLTKQNADILINYILKEIIGEEAVNYDYKNFKNSAVNFRDYVSTIAYLIYSQSYDGSGDIWTYNYTSSKDSSVKISYTFSVGERARAMSAKLMSEKAMDESWFDYNSSNPENSKIYTEVQAGFSARPATFVRYYEGEKLFGDFDAVDQFSGKPYAEYQSIVVDPKISEETLPSQGLELECGFCFNFMSKNKDLKIATKIRYYIYDEETGTGKLFEFDGNTIDFVSGANTFKNSAGETCYENDFDFSIDTAELEKLDPTLVRHEVQDNDPNACYYTVPFFKNSEIIQKAKESELSLSSEDASKIARLYKVIESEKGYGGLTVLDEKKVKSSFFEIVLDVIKSPEDENTDYNFSLVVSGTNISPGIW